ncbi:flagellar biosynthesis anti-sigma factor FlgM [Salibacterium salarium]|uniref:flagellar biosynthesis anti-sigma factor FlgM n=1 Tax=Salibacterium salarium TaxID=284579 RepID=UPI001639C0E5|nr:flagellar biosynthesis anti-sigma factor FlgM [Salibacterium salarium]
MNINSLGPVNNPYQKQADSQRSAQAEPPQQDQDKVEISNQAKQMHQGSEIEQSRQEKIDALKNKVESGEYKMDLQETAQKFTDFWRGK